MSRSVSMRRELSAGVSRQRRNGAANVGSCHCLAAKGPQGTSRTSVSQRGFSSASSTSSCSSTRRSRNANGAGAFALSQPCRSFAQIDALASQIREQQANLANSVRAGEAPNEDNVMDLDAELLLYQADGRTS
ncbi:unnamed protein product, partial [Amoebophrya sp. A25]|eukprot:GSA25T00014036001.1